MKKFFYEAELNTKGAIDLSNYRDEFVEELKKHSIPLEQLYVGYDYDRIESDMTDYYDIFRFNSNTDINNYDYNFRKVLKYEVKEV